MPTTDPPNHISSAVRSVGHATDRVADAVVRNGTNGLRGVLANNVGNLSAVAVVCGLVVYMVRDNAANARDDRQMFREELKAQRDTSANYHDKVVDKLDAVRTAVERNTSAVERIGSGPAGKTGMGKGGTIGGGSVSVKEVAPMPRVGGSGSN